MSDDLALRAIPLYKTHCAMCHGAEGAGDGPMARMLATKPRSFIDQPLRHVPTDQPRDELLAELDSVIRDGLPDQGMQSFGETLSDEEIRLLSELVLEWQQELSGG